MACDTFGKLETTGKKYHQNRININKYNDKAILPTMNAYKK